MLKPLTVWITANCGKFLNRWEYETTLPTSWEICMQVKKQQLGSDMEQQTVSRLGKEYLKAVYCHPDYLTYMQSTSWERPGWMKHKLESRLLGEIAITSDTQMTPSLWQKVKGNSRLSWWKGKRRVEEAGLKLNSQKTNIMASCAITSWQIDGETVADCIFLGSKITADGDCSHEITRHLLPGRKAMTNLESILKSRDITLPTKVHVVKAMVFPVVMYGCESWTIKKAEHQRIDAFGLTMLLEKTLESPLNCKEIKPVNPKGNQSWIVIGRSDAKVEAPILWPPEAKNWLFA